MRAERRKVENTKCDFLRVFAWRPAMRKCENAKMKDKITTLQAWRVFAWRPFAPPGEDTTNRRRKGETWKVSYFRVAGRKVAMRKHETLWLFRVFAWRPFAFSPRKHDNTTWHKSATIDERVVFKAIILYKMINPVRTERDSQHWLYVFINCLYQ